MPRQALKGPNGRVAIVDGLRTPFARMGTHYKDLTAIDLGQMAVAEMLARNDIEPTDIDLLVFGQVIQNPAAPNIAREIVLGTGMDPNTDAYSVSRACATSFQSTANVAEAILLGHADIGVAGGSDSSSAVPITVSKALAGTLRDAQKARSAAERVKLFAGLRPKDLLPVPPAIAEYSTGQTMGQSAEQMAKDHGIKRADQDRIAHLSHVHATQAWGDGKLDEEVMVAYPRGAREPVTNDNLVRTDSELDSYARLRPVFDKVHGTVTAANSSPLTDGAAALLLMSEKRAKVLGYRPLGFLRSFAFTARTPKRDLLMGPSYATPQALDRAGMKLADLDIIDMHEAFAAQILCNMQAFASKQWAERELGRSSAIGEIDPDKFNVLGGSIAYGHPFAATGARMITQTLNEMRRRGAGTALTTACAAGGLGAAMILEAA